MIGNTAERPLASTGAFDDFVGRYAAMGFTDLVFHHPRPDDPEWDEPASIVDEIATEVLPRWRDYQLAAEPATARRLRYGQLRKKRVRSQ